MPLKDQVKNYARKLVEPQPDEELLQKALRKTKPRALMFKDDGIVPNHPRWPLILHRKAINFPARLDQAAFIDKLFETNNWVRSWRDSIYDFVHYHSQVHEVLGVARGEALVEFGGINGKHLTLRPGDIAVLPAGTGHRLIEASRGFLVVGAYPPTGTYDECTDSRDRPDAIKRIAKVKKPLKDPVYGTAAGVPLLWKRR